MEIKQKPQLHEDWIDPSARDIVRRLQQSGFTSYLVGGCVRDLLAGEHPKDYDIATTALPEQVRRKIHGAYVIGRRFRLVLVKRGQQQYEVATFRRESRPEDFQNAESNGESVVGDNFFGTPEEDALRRDFTINALFYDPVKNELIDYAKGVQDVDDRIIRMIGDPARRLEEDPIRILRALRLSHKLRFSVENQLRQAMLEQRQSLQAAVLPRKREEYLKIMRLPHPLAAFMEMFDLGLMEVILPGLLPIFQSPDRLEIFANYLQKRDSIVQDMSDPIQLYTWFLYAYFRAMEVDLQKLEAQSPEEEEAWAAQNQEMATFFKDQLGLFRAEQGAVMSALSLQKNLQAVDSFKKRGQRRQEAFLRHVYLPLALRVATSDFLLPSRDLMYWSQRLNQENT